MTAGANLCRQIFLDACLKIQLCEEVYKIFFIKAGGPPVQHGTEATEPGFAKVHVVYDENSASRSTFHRVDLKSNNKEKITKVRSNHFWAQKIQCVYCKNHTVNDLTMHVFSCNSSASFLETLWTWIVSFPSSPVYKELWTRWPYVVAATGAATRCSGL